MAGLYLHIPFCASRCIYCSFYSTTGLELRQRYVDALCLEMVMRQSEASISTIYLGGGTPSQLTIDQLRQLFLYINKVYRLDHDVECTIEVNPDDVSVPYAKILSQLPVNRVSMGAQTFDNERLHFLKRRHTAEQVSLAVQHLRNAGIRNISVDLMYGFPSETLDDWQHDIDAVLELDVEHISAYCLIVEEGTPLYERLKMKDERLKMLDEEIELQMYQRLIDRLVAAGYEHYEISNFAKPGYRSRHNSNYWNDVPYIGLGAAAHSYDGSSRQWNVNDIHQYIETIERREIPCQWEQLDPNTHYNDRITTALRTCEGLDLTTLSDLHRTYCLGEAQRFLDNGLLRLNGSRLVLTRQGLFISDMIMSSLMFV